MERSEMKNPKQIAWDSSYSFGMTNGLPLHPQWPVMSERKNARLYRAAGSEGEDGNRARTV
ncbi:MAG TPA: hypothetical protein IAD06_09920 [Candidatus Caccoplasma intestinavium]|uniref:Uncharacterized protein n=1 Tax=Candidatus Caccoplasma intestinavium TaxID=2840716 RepID=A0A9D1KFC8_9BACT|nr:hypothetical protein [Candidatus Caccoplasma intestinavium]